MSLKKSLFFAVILAGLLFFVYKVEKPNEIKRENAKFFLDGAAANELKSVEVKRGSEAWKIVNNKPAISKLQTDIQTKKSDIDTKSWKLESRQDAKLDDGLVSTLLSSIGNLKLEDPVNLDASDSLANYGLEKPEVEIEAVIGDSTKKLAIGKKSEYLNKRYLKNVTDGKIYLTDEQIYSASNKSAFDIRSKSPISFDNGQIKQIVVANNLGKTVIEQDKDGWRITEPVAATGSRDNISTLLRELKAIKAKYFIDPPNVDLASKNLTNPLTKITINWGNEKEAPLEVSLSEVRQADNSAEIFMKIASQEPIFSTEEKDLSDFLKNVSDLREKKLFQFDSWTTKNAVVKKKDGVELKFDNENDLWKVDGQAADTEKVVSYLTDFMKVEAVSFLEADKDFSNIVPELTFEATLLDEKKVKLFIYPKDGNGDGAIGLREGSKEPFILSKTQFDGLMMVDASKFSKVVPTAVASVAK